MKNGDGGYSKVISLLAHLFEQVEDDSDFSEFMLQYTSGRATGKEDTKLLYHTAYEGPSTNFTVKNLRTGAPYSFRVRGRCDKCAPWSSWSLSHVSSTTIPHHRMFVVLLWLVFIVSFLPLPLPY